MAIELIAIKKNDKYYIRHATDKYFTFINLIFDNEQLKSYSDKWLVSSQLPKNIKKKIPASQKTIGYSLKEGFAISEKTPKKVPADYFEYLGDDEYKNNDIRALYQPEFEEIPEILEDIEFIIDLIDEDCEPLLKSKYPYVTDFPYFIDNHEVVRHIYPCHIEAVALYELIVKVCKENLPEHCIITSDYRFSFVVENKLPVLHEETHRADVSKYNSRKPKIEIKPLRTIPFKIIDIAPPKEKYGVTINSLYGTDYYDLERKIDVLLNEYKEKMNQKLTVCPHCKGYGFLQS